MTDLVDAVDTWLETGGDAPPDPPTPPPTLLDATQDFADALHNLAQAITKALVKLATDLMRVVQAFYETVTTTHRLVVQEIRAEQIYRRLRTWYLPPLLARVLARWWVRCRDP